MLISSTLIVVVARIVVAFEVVYHVFYLLYLLSIFCTSIVCN